MRPEHVTRFRREGLRALNADKSVLAGIEEVARLFKLNRLMIVEDAVKRFNEEIYMYVWNPDKGEPVKQFDDVLDAIRYGIYSEMKPRKRKTKGR
jgi:phage terminase large subunit